MRNVESRGYPRWRLNYRASGIAPDVPVDRCVSTGTRADGRSPLSAYPRCAE